MNKNALVDRIIQNRYLSHILFWVGISCIFTIIAAFSSGNIKEALISYLALLPIQIFAGYLLVYYQVPQLLLKKRYGLFAISFFVSIYFFSVLARLSNIYIAEPFFRENFQQEGILEVLTTPFHLVVIYFPAVYVIVFLMLVVKTTKDAFQQKHQLEIIQKEKANAELNFLKAQIHPHFLFNTLNNLYSLTLIKSDDAPELILKLSDMLDYMLYQCNGPSVPIIKEIELLESYIALESMRYEAESEISFSHKCDDPNCKIAPLILLSFVENAFKHGANGNPNNPKISIDLELKNAQLYFKVFNLKTPKLVQDKSKHNKEGIGFNNAAQQLELNYKDQYDLNIKETEKDYRVDLKIDLN